MSPRSATPTEPERAAQPPLGRREFDRISRFVRDELGIQLPPGKHTMVEARLRKRLRQLGLSDFRTYVDRVLDPDGDPAERQNFLDHITTNKTDLFREPDHFDHLADVALPALLAGRHRPRLDVWCAASSSGEEPYTIAMTLMDAKRRQNDFDFRVLASDISRRVLEKAVQAVYPAGHAEAVPAEYRSRYLLRSRDGTQIKMARSLRQRVTFGMLNLMQPPYRVPDDLDVIFCRNVLIYFDRPTQIRVVEALVDRLRPGGYLYLGHSESAQGAGPRVDRVGAAVYRRKRTVEGDGE